MKGAFYMGLDMSLVTTGLPVAEKIITNIADNYTKKKISDNELAMKLDDNRSKDFQTVSNNKLAIIQSGLDIVSGLIDFSTAMVQSYAQIRSSQEQTKQVQIQASAYVAGKKMETKQVQIQQENETARYFANLKTDLEKQRLEFEKVKMEFSDRASNREFEQEKWRRKVDFFERNFNSMIEKAETLRKICSDSDFMDQNAWDELQQIENKIYAYSTQINEIYR